ncbi:hypothetical protein [Chondrinema litorale]|uniref:hypothetical protein n=1 Tax=Chondrinema litorale TaxID=2994555 RepID=UPI002542EE05|nr:hypothetical protein [Chondrinema litorale]UZR92566.1 hypothetical protein OQ292_11910 [Chondrinema litorale]
MQEQFDKRLADKIRKEMASYEPPFDSGNWADMKSRLNGNTSAFGYKRYLVALLLFLTVGAVGYVSVEYFDVLGINKSDVQAYNSDDSASVLTDKQTTDSNDQQNEFQGNSNDLEISAKSKEEASNKSSQKVNSKEDKNTTGNTNNSVASIPDVEKENGINDLSSDANQQLAIQESSSKTDLQSNSNDELDIPAKANEEISNKGIKKVNSESGRKATDNTNNSIASKADVEKENGINELSSDANQQMVIQGINSSTDSETEIVEEALNADEQSVDAVLSSESNLITSNSITKEVSETEIKNVNLNLLGLKLADTENQFDLIPAPKTEKVLLKNDVSFSIVASGFANNNNRVDGYKKVGYGLGALVNVLPQRRFTFSTGIIIKKLNSKSFPDQSNYESTEELANSYYDARPSFSASSLADVAASTDEKTELVTVEAELIALEIPLNTTFNIFSGNGKRYFVSAGVSSYFYLSENYDFEIEKFELPLESNLRKLSLVEEHTSYSALQHFDLFSTVMISAGIEKRIGFKSSLTFEPYVQLPIRKMGSERVPVYSTGLMLKYNFGN